MFLRDLYLRHHHQCLALRWYESSYYSRRHHFFPTSFRAHHHRHLQSHHPQGIEISGRRLLYILPSQYLRRYPRHLNSTTDCYCYLFHRHHHRRKKLNCQLLLKRPLGHPRHQNRRILYLSYQLNLGRQRLHLHLHLYSRLKQDFLRPHYLAQPFRRPEDFDRHRFHRQSRQVIQHLRICRLLHHRLL